MFTAAKKCTHAFCLRFLLLIVFVLIIPRMADAVMPPKYYIEGVLASKIKAIATVGHVETIFVGEHNSLKKVTFRLEYALTDGIPKKFEGYCYSVETERQKANLMTGGRIHFYPQVGARIFVTVTNDGGGITSITPATAELERVVREEPERIDYRMREVRIKNKDGSGSRYVVTPEEIKWRKRSMEERRARKPVAEIDEYVEAVDRHGPEQDELQGQLLVALGDDDTYEAAVLIMAGADPNRPNAQGMTPLMYAESQKMAMLLVEHGAVPLEMDKTGDTMLHHAVSKQKAPELIRFFISQGVDPAQRGGNDATPAALALMYFHEAEGSDRMPAAESVLRALVEGGADLNALEPGGRTLLMSAAIWGDRPMVELLLKLGANPEIRDVNGKKARDWAGETGNGDLALLLGDKTDR